MDRKPREVEGGCMDGWKERGMGGSMKAGRAEGWMDGWMRELGMGGWGVNRWKEGDLMKR